MTSHRTILITGVTGNQGELAWKAVRLLEYGGQFVLNEVPKPTIACGNLPGVHGMSPGAPGTARRRSHGKVVLRVA
jgi:hypothetical protein